jgi:hypothetical protein
MSRTLAKRNGPDGAAKPPAGHYGFPAANSGTFDSRWFVKQAATLKSSSFLFSQPQRGFGVIS